MIYSCVMQLLLFMHALMRFYSITLVFYDGLIAFHIFSAIGMITVQFYF